MSFTPTNPEGHHRAIAEAIAEGMEAARLPTLHLTVFSGDPLDWPTWKVAFEAVIEKRTINSNERILYLLQYLSGSPKKIVKDISSSKLVMLMKKQRKLLKGISDTLL